MSKTMLKVGKSYIQQILKVAVLGAMNKYEDIVAVLRDLGVQW